MMRRNYNMKKTISMKQFVEELGQELSGHMKQRLFELGERCILTRKDFSHVLDLRHVEHIKYDCQEAAEGKDGKCEKEYAYGQLVVHEGNLYFSESCIENKDVMQSHTVNEIYRNLEVEETCFDNEVQAKHLDDSNIDFVIDSLLKVCPEESEEHKAIIAKYSKPDTSHGKTLSK